MQNSTACIKFICSLKKKKKKVTQNSNTTEEGLQNKLSRQLTACQLGTHCTCTGQSCYADLGTSLNIGLILAVVSFPDGIVDEFCRKLRKEGFKSDGRILVLQRKEEDQSQVLEIGRQRLLWVVEHPSQSSHVILKILTAYRHNTEQ